MNCDRAIEILKSHRHELETSRVASISLFGSTARREPDPSDVDLAVKFNANFSRGGFDHFGRLDELERRLSALLGCKVDIVEEPVRKFRIRQEIDRDRAIVF